MVLFSITRCKFKVTKILPPSDCGMIVVVKGLCSLFLPKLLSQRYLKQIAATTVFDNPLNLVPKIVVIAVFVGENDCITLYKHVARREKRERGLVKGKRSAKSTNKTWNCAREIKCKGNKCHAPVKLSPIYCARLPEV